MAGRYHIPLEKCFSSAEEMLEQDQLADAAFITTQDRQHASQAIKAMEKGYDILLEKPI
ncbi:Gfo/Idh/MocA family oxidoreductase [[Clostridium] scindens]